MSTDHDLMHEATVDPLGAAQLAQNEVQLLEKSHNEQLHHLIAVGYAIGHALARDYPSWKKFKRDAFWDRRTKRLKDKDQQHAHQHAMVFVFLGTTKQRYDRAWKYAVAVEPFWEKGAKPEEVLAAVREFGHERLLQESLKIRAQRKEQRERDWDKFHEEYFAEIDDMPDPEDEETADETDSDTSSEDASEEPAPKKPAPKARTKDAKTTDDPAIQSKKPKFLRLRASRKLRIQIKALAVGEKARLIVKRIDGQPSAVRVVKFVRIAS